MCVCVSVCVCVEDISINGSDSSTRYRISKALRM